MINTPAETVTWLQKVFWVALAAYLLGNNIRAYLKSREELKKLRLDTAALDRDLKAFEMAKANPVCRELLEAAGIMDDIVKRHR